MDKMKKLMKMIAIPMVILLLSASSMTNIACNVKINHQLQQSIDEVVLQTNFKPHVVVAMIDSGINVYHEIFRREDMVQHPSTYIGGFPEDAEAINLTFGDDWESNYENDKEIWENLEEKKLYWFPHTNIIGISFGQSTWYGREEPGDPILDDVGHGTSTSSIIEKINPNVTILMVETGGNKLKEALSWTVNRSWIDIIVPEFGVWYRPRMLFWTTIWWSGFQEISKRGVKNGKIIVTAAGNRPWIIPELSYISGPPWVISVGGAEGYCHGIDLSTAKSADYVSTFTRKIAFHFNTSTYWVGSGTSLSIPTVAGTLSSIILKIREELNELYLWNKEWGID
ncbi:MAG: hypothetical protein U9O96_06705 [Candidatus Thermoplasmatota archaeon]|nr:hypothetical protein [Candidatus Thermoplasmatota archaeon]